MVSTLEHHTVPRFYGCYLLNSVNKNRAATYIGSTPDPPRRIKQHNGIIAGGAVKTKRGRPWNMELVVHGFPSKLQALQFEWAWQNPHASRHLRSLTAPSAQFARNALSNKPLVKVQVLCFMLCSAPWASFNLEVTMFCEEARGWWDQARKLGPVVRTEAARRAWAQKGGDVGEQWGLMGPMLDKVKLNLMLDGVDGLRRRALDADCDEVAPAKMSAHDDNFFDAHWAKWNERIATVDVRASSCAICLDYIDTSEHLDYFLCASASPSHASCSALFHLPCLAKSFNSAASASAEDKSLPLLPISGACTRCNGPLHWQDLVRGSYRRQEEVDGNGRKKPKPKLVKLSGSQATKAKGKGKEKAVEESDDSDEEERFDFDGDEESGAELQVEGQDEDEGDVSWAFEQEKSWTKMNDEDGGGGASFNFADEFDAFATEEGAQDNDGWEDDGGVLFYEPTPSPARPSARCSSPARPPSSPARKSRSKSPKQQLLKAPVTKAGLATKKAKPQKAPSPPVTPQAKEKVVYEVLSASPSPPPAPRPKARRIGAPAVAVAKKVEKKKEVEVLVISDSD